MTLTSTILYPNTPGKTFDLGYYLTSHMPLTEKLWGPLGMTSWVVVQFQPGADGAAPPYRLKTVTEWESRERLEKAMASEKSSAIYEDVARFTDEIWIGVVGQTVGRSERKG